MEALDRMIEKDIHYFNNNYHRIKQQFIFLKTLVRHIEEEANLKQKRNSSTDGEKDDDHKDEQSSNSTFQRPLNNRS